MSKINVISLIEGVFWVEIEEVNLRILCAAPADSVKHMMKKGLMDSSFENGYFIEKGPNAILLSDVMIQNGSFANLAEFPVLQMLYRQGLLIPTHPNNTGQKPLLIGTQEQISLQLDYITRGNYGLFSREEIMECDISEELADELMDMKLKFAFGKINNASDLLDSVVIAKKEVEIKDGVTITRKEVNKFILSYDGESCEIDLNLSVGASYKSPFSLGFYNFKREHFSILHSGEGDGWDINRTCMSSILIHQGKIYLIDAGPNLDSILNSLGIGVNEIEGIFHTHSHDDHFSGLTTLLRADHKIKYFATHLVRLSVGKKLGALLGINEEEVWRYFDYRALQFDEWNNVGSLQVMPMLSPHPVETNIYHFRTMFEDGYKSYLHYADLTSFKVLKSMIAKKGEIGITQERYDRTIEQYLKAADIKKVDVGGGMIHGEVHDYQNDVSDKIILAHSSTSFNTDQKLVGSSAPFGTMDTLIESKYNYEYEIAFRYLQNYFSSLELDTIHDLLNYPIKTFNPQSVILKEGEKPKSIFMIITGNVEVLKESDDNVLNFNAGTLLGEMTVLLNQQLSVTYRSESYVRVLEIPAVHFKDFVNTYEQTENLKEFRKKRLFLSHTWLFSESITSTNLKMLSKKMQLLTIKAGDTIENIVSDEFIYIIYKGQMKYSLQDIDLGSIKDGDCFGESILFNKPQIATIKAIVPTQVYTIPINIVKSIPYVQWKLYEINERRFVDLLCELPDNTEYLTLTDDNKSDINQIDKLHHHLLDSYNILLFVNTGNSKEEKYNALKALFSSAKNHFYIEETLLIQYKHPEFRKHRKEHKIFLKYLNNELKRVSTSNEIDIKEISDWISKHFVQDKKMASYLVEKGVY